MTAKKILVVDDSIAARIGMSLSLKKYGFEVVEASSGPDGIEKLECDNSIALMVVDYYMEKMNGLEMVAKIREIPVYGKLPVIMWTSDSSKDLKQKSKELGVIAWAVKPCPPDTITELIRKVLGSPTNN
ncbi:MAG: response regulator [Oligoflexales bacterium]|nr:response regulator [Oligoflexales bacterium]